jgi:hypothetical protein
VEPDLGRATLPNLVEDKATRDIRDVCYGENLEGFAAIVETG